MTEPPSPSATPSPLHKAAVFGTGFFSLSLIPMMTLIVPLWALSLEASAFAIGLAISLRAVLAMFLSIQTGAVMDRLGTRRVTLVLAAAGAALVWLYPLLPTVGAILALQAIVGFLHLTCWIGAQALVGRVTRGEPRLLGYFTFLSTLGNFLGPFLAGVAWEHVGPWGAFGTVSVWSLAFLLVTAAVPRGVDSGATERIGVAQLRPRGSDYAAGFGLLRVPMIAFVITVSAVLAGTYAMRHTFLAVYLKSIELQGTEIGFLVGSIALAGSLSGLAVGRIATRVPPPWLILIGTAFSTAAFTAVPLFTGFWSLLALALATGIFSGLAFPMILSVLTRGAGTDKQGLAVGLRATLNRTASMAVPVTMGAVVGATSLATGFFIIGGAIIGIVCIMAFVLVGIVRRAEAGAAEETHDRI